jgi:hypothetical protein
MDIAKSENGMKKRSKRKIFSAHPNEFLFSAENHLVDE